MSPRERRALAAVLALIFAIALALRLTSIAVHGGGQDYVEWAHANHFGLIVQAYVDSARALADGHGYRELLRPPGQSAMFAALMKLGVGVDGWRATQSLFDALAAVLLAVAAMRLGVRPWLAVAACLPVALLPPWTVGGTLLLAEWIAPLAVTLVLALSAMGETRASPARWVMLGAVIAAAALFRPDLIVLAPLAAGVWALRWLGGRGLAGRGLAGRGRAGRARWPEMAALFLAATLPLCVWGLHNLRTHGTFVLLSTSGGSALYQGLGAVENTHGFVMSDRLTEQMLHERGMAFGSPEGDRELKRLWREAVVAHPGHVLATVRHRWSRMLTIVDSPLGERSSVTESLLVVGWCALLPATAILLVRRRPDLALVLWMPLLLGLMATGLTHAEARYVRFVPLTGLLAIAIVLSAAVDALARRGERSAAYTAWASAGLAAALLVAPVALHTIGELRRVRAGWSLAEALRGPSTTFAEDAIAPVAVGDASWDPATRRLMTGAEPYSGAASTAIDTDGARAVAVRVRGEVLDGGFTISLVDERGRSLAAKAIGRDGIGAASGPWTLVAGVEDARTRVVIANRNPVREPSTLRIDAIDLHVDAPADSRATAALEAIAATRIVGSGAAAEIGVVAPGRWTVEGGGSIEPGEAGLLVTTDTTPASYQASVVVETGGRRWIAVRYRVRIEEGGASIGVLSGDRARWLDSATHDGSGVHEGTLVVATGGRPEVVLMLSNHRPGAGGRSRLIVESMAILGPR